MQGRQVQDVGNGIRDLCILLSFPGSAVWWGLGRDKWRTFFYTQWNLNHVFYGKYMKPQQKKGKNKHTNKRKKKEMFSDDQASREALCWIKYFGNGSKGTFRHTEIMMIPAQRNKRDQSTDTFTLEQGITNLSPAFFRHFKLHPWQQRKAIFQSNKNEWFFFI